MAGILPQVYSGSTALYPVQRSWSFDSYSAKSYSGTEQRFKRRGALAGFTLTYTNISTADKNKLDTFVAAQKGAYDSTWVMELNANPLPYNGHFTKGTTGWVLQNDASNTFITSTISPSIDPSETADAYLYNQAILLQPNAYTASNFFTTTPIPCTVGQALYVTYANYPVTSVAFPYNVNPTIQCEVNLFDENGTYLTNYVLAANAGVIPITTAGAATAVIYFVPRLTNTAPWATAIPFNSVAFRIVAVRAVVTGQPGTYIGCGFDQDEIAWSQTKDFADRWSGSIKVRQTIPQSLAALLVNQPYPPNGDFRKGSEDWALFADANQAFYVGCDRTYTRAGENNAWAYNLLHTLPANGQATCAFTSALFPATVGQSLVIAFASLLGYNGFAPSGTAIGTNLTVSCYNIYGQFLSSGGTGWSRTISVNGGQPEGWQTASTSFAVTTPGTTQVSLSFTTVLSNLTGAPLTVPYNVTAAAIGSVLAALGSGNVYPTVRNAIVTGFPYTADYRFYTDRNDLPAGPRISWAWYGAGLTNFPNRSLKSWGLSYSQASDADLATIEQFFLICGGKYNKFQFTDPDTGITYPNVRFDMDALDITHRQVNLNEFKVTLTEVWAAN